MMAPLPETQLAPSIQSHLDEVNRAKDALKVEVAAARQRCQHRIVSEMPYRSSDYGKIGNAERICNHCRFVEEGSHWSGGATWSRVDYTKPTLGNENWRLVVPITSDEFYKMRI